MNPNIVTPIEIDNAKEFLSKIDGDFFEKYQFISEPICNYAFDKVIDVSSLIKPRFTHCTFSATQINGAATAKSFFEVCQLQGCSIFNSNFKFSSFLSSHIKETTIKNTSFEDTIFDKTNLEKCEIQGCSFVNSIISKSVFTNLSVDYCDFEGSLLSDLKIRDTDFSNNGFNYAEFNNVSLENVILPFADIFHCYKGLELLSECAHKVYLSFKNSNVKMSGDRCIALLNNFLPFFYSKKDYMAVSNIYIYLGEHDNAYCCIIEGLKDSLERKDFKQILYLCKLASFNSFFTRKQLKEFYTLLKSDAVIAKLNSYEYKYYLTEMDAIKKLLIDNPFGMSQLVIEISTNILPDDYTNLNLLIQKIDKIVDEQLPQANKFLSLRHNSPNVLELFLSESLPNLILFVGYFSTILLGSTKIIKELQTIVKSNREIEGIELDNLIKKQELGKLKLEQANKNKENNSVHTSEHINKIAYHINTNISLSPDLRQNTYINF